MIKFNSFINSIHAAILSANDALVDKNLEIIEKFFESTEGQEEPEKDTFDREEIQRKVDEAMETINELFEKKQALRELGLKRVFKTLEEMKGALSQEAVASADGPSHRGELRPKMTTILYPQKTANGVVMSQVTVPLITLVPLSMTQISEVKLKTDLEIQIEDNELIVNFPTSRSVISNEKEEKSSSSSQPISCLEITLTPHLGTEGLKKVVEGYEKVLRSQIP